MSDKELIAKIRQGDERAFRSLVEKHQGQVINTCYGFLRNKEDAEDIAQDVFIEVFRSVGSFRGDAKLSTWLYRIAVNKSLNHLQKHKYKKWINSIQSSFLGEDKEYQIKDDRNPQSHYEDHEREIILHNAIDGLAENQKIAFTLHKYDGLSYKETAEVMGTSLSSVESLIHRAKQNLKKRLFNYYKNNL